MSGWCTPCFCMCWGKGVRCHRVGYLSGVSFGCPFHCNNSRFRWNLLWFERQYPLKNIFSLFPGGLCSLVYRVRRCCLSPKSGLLRCCRYLNARVWSAHQIHINQRSMWAPLELERVQLEAQAERKGPEVGVMPLTDSSFRTWMRIWPSTNFLNGWKLPWRLGCSATSTGFQDIREQEEPRKEGNQAGKNEKERSNGERLARVHCNACASLRMTLLELTFRVSNWSCVLQVFLLRNVTFTSFLSSQSDQIWNSCLLYFGCNLPNLAFSHLDGNPYQQGVQGTSVHWVSYLWPQLDALWFEISRVGAPWVSDCPLEISVVKLVNLESKDVQLNVLNRSREGYSSSHDRRCIWYSHWVACVMGHGSDQQWTSHQLVMQINPTTRTQFRLTKC